MKISLTDAGKRFNRDWIFRHFNLEFRTGASYAITGPNGSGKSTLLQIISGNMMLSEGKINWSLGGQNTIRHDQVYNHISIAAPYLEVVEEMTMREFLRFHHHFKPLVREIDFISSSVGLHHSLGKQIRYFSSGMKQRLRLAQAMFSDVDVILLDEPCTNLDSEGIAIYHDLIQSSKKDKLVIVGSNDEAEIAFTDERIKMTLD